MSIGSQGVMQSPHKTNDFMYHIAISSPRSCYVEQSTERSMHLSCNYVVTLAVMSRKKLIFTSPSKEKQLLVRGTHSVLQNGRF